MMIAMIVMMMLMIILVFNDDKSESESKKQAPKAGGCASQTNADLADRADWVACVWSVKNVKIA